MRNFEPLDLLATLMITETAGPVRPRRPSEASTRTAKQGTELGFWAIGLNLAKLTQRPAVMIDRPPRPVAGSAGAARIPWTGRRGGGGAGSHVVLPSHDARATLWRA